MADTIIHDGFLKVISREVDGHKYEIVKKRDAVAVLLVEEVYNEQDKRTNYYYYFVEQDRPAVGKIIEVPAETIEDGESPELAAFRALREELGIELKEGSKLSAGTPQVSAPGYSTEIIYPFFGIFKTADITHVEQKLDPTEKIKVLCLSEKEFGKLILADKRVDLKTAVLLMYTYELQKMMREKK